MSVTTERTASSLPPAAFVDRRALERDLRASVRGEVRFDAASRGLYATDASNYRQVPIGVVIPRDAEDVVRTIEVAREHRAPILSRGGGTSLAGQCCNAAIVMDHSKYFHQIVRIDADRRRAWVRPGCVLDRLRSAAERHHLTFGPDPATHDHNTLGGMVGNDSCGVHSVMAGKTVDNIESLEVVTYDGVRMRVGATSAEELDRIVASGGRRGEIYRRMRELRDRYAGEIRRRYPKIPRRVSGYNLDQLLPENGFNVARALVGSESTLATILEIEARLVESPPGRALLVLGYEDVFAAGDHVPQVLTKRPIACEGLDDLEVDDMKKQGIHPEDVELMPRGRGWLLVEFGGDTDEAAAARAREAERALAGDALSSKVVTDRHEQHQIWIVRESGLGATARVPGEPDTWPGWEDSAVPPDKVGPYLRDLRRLMDGHGYTDCSLYGHFGDGCVHVSISFDLKTAAGIANYKSFLDEASDAVLRYGGSLSGEHGDGQARADLLPKMFGDDMVRAFAEFKDIWDPDGLMNPGKIVRAYHVDENLRLGTRYDPPVVPTYFDYGTDGSFANATLRCFGVGECRREEHATMCPSYRVTREEKHSTRGRARLLFEMMQGDPVSGGWDDEGVHDALDLCLACKGCKGDCPLHVDMASYKAEFLAHHYAGKLRPRSAYAMGLIYWGARAASHAPWLVNALAAFPPTGRIAKDLAGIAPERRIPRFADVPFTTWFRRHRAPADGMRVILWPDTFNNYFHPDTAKNAVRVLESLGFRVEIPAIPLCCGRPLYDFGFLTLARRLLRQTLTALRDDVRGGVPVVGLEPSCVTVFRDELGKLFPQDEDAKRLAQQTLLFSELLDRHPELELPHVRGRALVHGHCHHKSVLGFEPERRVLDRIGIDHEILDSGCCGMAGSFGFERQHYDVSTSVGELVLLPRVRSADGGTLIVSDGFSCREQIAQSGGRDALHLADLMARGLGA